MAGVFLSYDREDSDRARQLAQALERAGHEVWWDLHVRGGAQFSKVIEEALKAANAVVVLWSEHSIESTWVKDEAAVGRDTGRLVPVTIDGTEPPLGFRQFQTIDLSRWKGRGKPARLQALLADVEAMAPAQSVRASSAPPSAPPTAMSIAWRPLLIAAGALTILFGAGVGAWQWLGRGGLPVVEVGAANPSRQSQAIASDLFVKLGSLAQVGEGKWQLVDRSSAPKNPDLLFRTADTSSRGKPQASLVLLDGRDNGLLWSREFSFPAGGEADLRQQLSLTAGRVLDCALESRDAGGLRRDLLKLFLNACAILAEASQDQPESVSGILRTIVSKEPRFVPAWSRLLDADMGAVDWTPNASSNSLTAVTTLRSDMAKARSVAPELPELTIAEANLLPATHYADNLRLLEKAASRAPNTARVFAEQSDTLMRVGRMDDAAAAARRASQLDPLSPATTTNLIMTLAYAGQIDAAREELARAEKTWAGTGALRDAQWGFYLRYGDPNVARRYANQQWEGLDLYLKARTDRSPANVQRLVEFIHVFGARPTADRLAWATQALAEFDQTDEVFKWFELIPTPALARMSYLFFRPAFQPVLRDPRFMSFAKRIGLVDYWRDSGMWPDFCSHPKLPYDCKQEAAKLGA